MRFADRMDVMLVEAWWFGLGLAATVALWIVQRRQWAVIVRVLATGVLALLTGVTSWVFSHDGLTTLGSDAPWTMRPPGREIVLFAAMLVGMLCRFLTKAIEDRRERIAAQHTSGKSRRKPSLEIDRWELVYPMLFSVVTFGALLVQIKSPGVNLENGLISFQTGFFWQTVLAGKSEAPKTNS